jgi:hypothetical protein
MVGLVERWRPLGRGCSTTAAKEPPQSLQWEATGPEREREEEKNRRAKSLFDLALRGSRAKRSPRRNQSRRRDPRACPFGVVWTLLKTKTQPSVALTEQMAGFDAETLDTCTVPESVVTVTLPKDQPLSS